MSIPLQIIPPLRGIDSAGNGAFGARRGSRVHRGTDIQVIPGSLLLSLTPGLLSRQGYAYSNDLTYRILDLLIGDYITVRYFYATLDDQGAKIGDMVKAGDVIGRCQDITQRFPNSGMLPHIHLEVYNVLIKEHLDPEHFFLEYFKNLKVEL
jgi:murein DD-endopeptidase MepM/ murein hydrolase activator NlpD